VSDPLDRLNRFVVAHGPCGDVTFDDPTEADLIDGGAEVWITGRCNGCGATTREHVATKPWFAQLFTLLSDAGISRDEFTAGALGDDDARLKSLAERLGQSPAFLRQALRDIRKAQAAETQN